ncbi:hypothetical protein QJS10_CPB15g01663 [Acorus calamus]|uniref:K-box domain-containing protein n=1 Tax=Acorus calamus TaxID=4465 RepID=A0AAV9D7T0_ACOCL|nr:hypothetical protein QJS10_CPB15g01663 [Acorus calamus]
MGNFNKGTYWWIPPLSTSGMLNNVKSWKDNMLKTLDRYQKCSFHAAESSAPSRELQSSYQEYLKLKAKVEALQRSQRNLLGEDLGPLNSKELEQLESHLEMSLKQVRSTKTQYMLDQLCDLKRKLDEYNSENPLQLSWDNGGSNVPYGRQPTHSEDFFQPLPVDPSLHIGYQVNAAETGQNVNGFIPGWMT